MLWEVQAAALKVRADTCALPQDGVDRHVSRSVLGRARRALSRIGKMRRLIHLEADSLLLGCKQVLQCEQPHSHVT